ncbi:MAG: neuraminidase [Calditrichaeota bacterium]|nr:MAG: neuraminidase [Calditrichota bacterium]
MLKLKTLYILILTFPLTSSSTLLGQEHLIPVAKGWAKNSVNAVIFRRNSVVTHGTSQYVAFYDSASSVVLAKRKLGTTKWEIKRTRYKGRTRDAHNAISIMVDGDGFLHMAWDHHGDSLNYCRSTTAGSLELTEKLSMTGYKEDNVTYPEFYRMANGDLIFLYRDGSSGRGNLMMNYYDRTTKTWTLRQDAFIHGEGERNAYWQMCTDVLGTIHISWVWRETGDVATNHDICYAKSTDGGKSWQKSDGTKYILPITAKNAEYVANIPQNSELINTTSMCADAKGRPYIASYWRPAGTSIPQYHILYLDGNQWHIRQVGKRTTPFTLSGRGTRRIPISRCQVLVQNDGTATHAYVIFRDSERKNRISLARTSDLHNNKWDILDLTTFSLGMWEPSYDTELWNQSKRLHLFVQFVGQGNGEKLEHVPPQEISILEWEPMKK